MGRCRVTQNFEGQSAVITRSRAKIHVSNSDFTRSDAAFVFSTDIGMPDFPVPACVDSFCAYLLLPGRHCPVLSVSKLCRVGILEPVTVFDFLFFILCVVFERLFVFEGAGVRWWLFLWKGCTSTHVWWLPFVGLEWRLGPLICRA